MWANRAGGHRGWVDRGGGAGTDFLGEGGGWMEVEEFRAALAGELRSALQEPPFRELPIALAGDAVERMIAFAVELVRTNESFNLTAITDPQGVAVKHLCDSLTPFLVGEWPEEASVCDVGTGGGLPGMVLGIARPDLAITFVDSSQKKVGFVDRCVKELGVKGRAVHARAEELGQQVGFREAFAVVTARAVARLPVLLELCLPLCRTGGWFVAMKGPGAEEEIRESEKALRVLGGRVDQVKAVRLPGDAGERWLVAVRKVGPTPPAYPRRPGMPAKKPLV